MSALPRERPARRCITDHIDAWRLDALHAAQLADHGRIIPLADDDELTATAAPNPQEGTP